MWNYLKSLFSTVNFLHVLALALLAGSLTVKWFDVPLGKSLKIYNIALFQNRFPLSPGFVPVSFGVLVSVLILAAIYAVRKDAAWVRVLIGFAALFGGALIFCKVALYNPATAEDIFDQHLQVSQMAVFSRQLPPNRGVDPSFIKDIATETVADRLYLTWHFLTWGWYFLMISGVILLGTTLAGRKDGKLNSLSLLSSAAMILALFGISARPLLAEYYRSQGDVYLSLQLYRESHDSFNKALYHNQELMKNDFFSRKYGETCYHLKMVQSPYYHLYWGTELFLQGKQAEAVDIFSEAVRLSREDPDVKKVLARILAGHGIAFFSKGVLGPAIQTWERSLFVNPAQIENWYYMSFAYTKLGLYKYAVSAGQQFTLLARNRSLLANTYANMGDACYWSKEYVLAREYYAKSQIEDLFLNYRAGRSLGGI